MNDFVTVACEFIGCFNSEGQSRQKRENGVHLTREKSKRGTAIIHLQVQYKRKEKRFNSITGEGENNSW